MFIIRVRYEATKENTDFEGAVNYFYYGKRFLSKNKLPDKWDVANYGYKNKSAAEKSIEKFWSNEPVDSALWNRTCDVVEM